MCSPCRSPWRESAAALVAAAGLATALAACSAAPASGGDPRQAQSSGGDQDGTVLRVCADPNNLPFSNEAGEGFENRLAELVASEMGAGVQYTWWAQRRGFVRNTVTAGQCDVVMGVPTDYEPLAVTAPYYRASYVFLSRGDRHLAIESLDDEALRRLRIGVHVIGDDYGNPPPVHSLAHRGIVQNVVGYSIFGDYRMPNPPARLVEAVAGGDVDLAILWGPIAGYFARLQPEPMRIVAVPADRDLPILPYAFDIAVGVNRERPALLASIEDILSRRAVEIDGLLDEFGIPHITPYAAPGTH